MQSQTAQSWGEAMRKLFVVNVSLAGLLVTTACNLLDGSRCKKDEDCRDGNVCDQQAGKCMALDKIRPDAGPRCQDDEECDLCQKCGTSGQCEPQDKGQDRKDECTNGP